jgi:hypothetical protein
MEYCACLPVIPLTYDIKGVAVLHKIIKKETFTYDNYYCLFNLLIAKLMAFH